MPRIFPDITNSSKEVIWPKNEGCIGVVGVAPWATLDFCRKVYEQIKATKDWHYPRLLVDANSKIPSRGRHLELGERDPSPYIKTTIQELATAGATVAVVPCNTAHILFHRWAESANIEVLNIVEETVRQLVGTNRKTAVLGSAYLAESGLYFQAISAAGHSLIALKETEQKMVSRCINELKASPVLSDESQIGLKNLAHRLHQAGVDSIILACTELSLISEMSIWGPLQVIDSNQALATAAIQSISKP